MYLIWLPHFSSNLSALSQLRTSFLFSGFLGLLQVTEAQSMTGVKGRLGEVKKLFWLQRNNVLTIKIPLLGDGGRWGGVNEKVHTSASFLYAQWKEPHSPSSLSRQCWTNPTPGTTARLHSTTLSLSCAHPWEGSRQAYSCLLLLPPTRVSLAAVS